MISVTCQREIALTPRELLEEFKSCSPGDQIFFLELLADHVYENNEEYHRAAKGSYHDGSHYEDWLRCTEKVKELLSKDYPEAEEGMFYIALRDVITSAKVIRK